MEMTRLEASLDAGFTELGSELRPRIYWEQVEQAAAIDDISDSRKGQVSRVPGKLLRLDGTLAQIDSMLDSYLFRRRGFHGLRGVQYHVVMTPLPENPEKESDDILREGRYTCEEVGLYFNREEETLGDVDYGHGFSGLYHPITFRVFPNGAVTRTLSPFLTARSLFGEEMLRLAQKYTFLENGVEMLCQDVLVYLNDEL